MYIDNVLVFTSEHEFVPGWLKVAEGRIDAVAVHGERLEIEDGSQVIDGGGCYAIAGLVDIHLHGCMGADVSDALPDSLPVMAEYEASQGVTTICPATMTMSKPELHSIMHSIAAYQEPLGKVCAHLGGINMEGPFVSPARKGAQKAENIIPCSVELFQKLQEECGGLIRLVDIAPEEPGAMEFIGKVKDEVAVSLAHTAADYDTAMEAFRSGASHVTHLYNAMNPFHHRSPGVPGAAADTGAYVELICDGVHIHPAMARAMFKLFGSHRICLISDSMRAAGLADGDYTLGGQQVKVEGSLATLADGTIAGSVTNLMKCMKKVVQDMGISLEEAVEAATETPARSVGLDAVCGTLSPQKQADIVLLDRKLDIKLVMVGGKIR